jgi:hypothetical protein
MYAAVRPYATAGIALVGAGVIAVSPLAPPMPHIQAVQRAASSAGVELEALVNPIEAWVQVLQQAGANIKTLTQAITDNPTPVLDQVIANQTANWQAFAVAAQPQIQQIQSILDSAPINLQRAWVQVQAGNLVTNGTDENGNLISTGALNLVNDQIVSPIMLSAALIGTDAALALNNTVQQFATAMATVLPAETDPYNAGFLTAVLPLVLPVVSVMNALVQTTEGVVNGVGSLNLAAAVNAVVNAPATLVGAFLNGLGEVAGSPAPGILTPWSDNYGEFGSGPIGALNYLRGLFAEALGAKAPASAASFAVTPAAATSAVASVPTANKTVTLSTTGRPALGAAAATVSTKSASVQAKVESSTGSADSTVSGTPAPSPADLAGSVVRKAHDSAKPGTAQQQDAHSAKAGRSGKSGKPGK